MFGKLLTNQKIAHKIVKPYVYKALREGLKLMTTVKYKISEGSIPSLSEAFIAFKQMVSQEVIGWVWRFLNQLHRSMC